MRHRYKVAVLSVLLAGLAQGAHADEPVAPLKTDLPAGVYQLDPAHASLTFKVNHLGMTDYTAGFGRISAELELDPVNPADSKVRATIDPASLTLFNPPEGFKAMLLGEGWFDSQIFPKITFVSSKVELVAPSVARIDGSLELHGIAQPVELEATFNGGYASHPMDPTGSRIGFSARGTLKRSAFGMGAGTPAPGTSMGVSDDVAFEIQAEFVRPQDQASPDR